MADLRISELPVLAQADAEATDDIAVADNSPTKIGKLTPGTHIPIVPDKEFNNMEIDYALLLSWNYVDFFIKNTEYIKNNGKFIVPLPKLKILP